MSGIFIDICDRIESSGLSGSVENDKIVRIKLNTRYSLSLVSRYLDRLEGMKLETIQI